MIAFYLSTGCISELDADEWPADDVIESEGELSCNSPDAPVVTLLNPHSADSMLRGDTLRIVADVVTCRRVKAVYAEITDPMSSDRVTRVHKYQLYRTGSDSSLRQRNMRVPRNAPNGMYSVRIVVISSYLDEEEKETRGRNVFIREETSSPSITFTVETTRDAGPAALLRSRRVSR